MASPLPLPLPSPLPLPHHLRAPTKLGFKIHTSTERTAQLFIRRAPDTHTHSEAEPIPVTLCVWPGLPKQHTHIYNRWCLLKQQGPMASQCCHVFCAVFYMQ